MNRKFFNAIKNLLFVLCAVSCLFLFNIAVAMDLDDSCFRVTDLGEKILLDNEHYLSRQRNMKFDGGYFFVREIYNKTGAHNVRNSFFVPGSSMTVYYYDKDKQLVSMSVENGALPITTVFLRTEKYDLWLSPAFQFEDIYKNLIRKSENALPVTVVRRDGSFEIIYSFPAKKASRNVMWGVCSSRRLIDFDSAEARLLGGYDLSNTAVLGYWGYYYMHPDKRLKDIYYPSPAPYLARAFVFTGGNRLAYILGQCFLNIHIDGIIEEGYFPTLHDSSWLIEDYGIEAPYFDNRWNSDLVLVLLRAFQRYGEEYYLNAALRIADFFAEYVDECGVAASEIFRGMDGSIAGNADLKSGRAAIATGGLSEGDALLIPDYVKNDCASGISLYNHTSLNHQLSVISMFYKAFEITGDTRYEQCGDKLLRGIEFIGEAWIREDGDLHYLIDGSGIFRRYDYRTLTYNDLKYLQNHLCSVKGGESPILNKLIESKSRWLNTH